MFRQASYIITAILLLYFSGTAQGQFTVAAPTPGDQEVPYGGVPAQPFVSAGVSGGPAGGAYVYQWQSGTTTNFSNITYTDITGATSLTLTLTAAMTNYQVYSVYRLKVTETHSGSVVYSDFAFIQVDAPIQASAITPVSQTMAYNGTGSTITVTGITGGGGYAYSYQWQSSTDQTTWTNLVAYSTSITPAGFTTDTYFRLKITTSNGGLGYSPVAVVHVEPQLFAGAIAQGDITIASGTSPGMLYCTPAYGGGCGGNYTYQWQTSADKVNWSNAGSGTLNYLPGNISAITYFRVKVSCDADVQYSSILTVRIGTAGDMNFVRTRTILKPGITTQVLADSLSRTVDATQVTQYYDGLGRPVETVAMQASPMQKDMVSFQLYDAFGRESLKYLPYTSTTTDGSYRMPLGEQNAFNAGLFPSDQFFYGQTVYEPSPLNRPVATYAAGNSWMGLGNGVFMRYKVNLAQDSVHIWNIDTLAGSRPVDAGTYGDGQLYKNITTDEQGHSVIEYRDKDNHIILKKVQLWDVPAAGPSGWLNTYYVYDDLGNLRFAMQPKAVDWLKANGWSFSGTAGTQVANELCFRYEYDIRNRLIIKKIPGSGEQWLIYDQWDRQVLSQDATLRTQHKWVFTKFDGLNRPVATGFYVRSTDTTQQAMQAYLNTQNMARFENYQTASFPLYSLNQSFPAVAVADVLTFTYYDTYSWAGWYGDYGSKDNSYDGQFPAASNSTYPYPQPLTQSSGTAGLITGVWDASGAGGMLKALYYDDRKRVIQTKYFNQTTGVDVATTQYGFDGKPLQTYLRHQKGGANAQTHTVKTVYQYDAGGRIKATWKNIDNTGDQLIDSLQYNELGHLRAKYLGNSLDSMVYDYNIRGWISGINKRYLSGAANNFFGMELGYDQQSSITGGTFSSRQLNGNVAGMVWKGAGNGINFKYDYSYDNVNRMTRAAFTQNTSASIWDSALVNFSVNNLSYDANGNILTMNQSGLKGTNSALIDVLTYSYQANSNKLNGVSDAVNDSLSLLGDFHYRGAKQSADYAYDGDGDVISDNNKTIDNIQYNYLHLPTLVHLKGKGNIQYAYDAGGIKLSKTTTDSLSRHVTTTTYVNGFVYQRRDTITGASAVDTVQFLMHEEGRIRWAFHRWTTGVTGYKWEYDFFEKDHLGNVREVLTQQRDTAQYLATMEAVYRNTENALFYNIPQTCVWSYYVNAASGANPFGTTVTNPNDSVSRISGSTPKEGPAIILKVMAGDKYQVGVSAFWKSGQTSTGTTDATTEILSSLANGIISVSGTTKGGYSTLSNTTSSPLLGGVNAFRTGNNPTPPTTPKAYLNYVALDDQFNYDASASGAQPVGGPDNLATLGSGVITIKKSGYLYIYLSNETKSVSVFFDNLSIMHYSGPLLEETHYYPMGLTMTGVSDKALKGNYAENRYKYNGKELQNKEFSDGSGLDEYDYGARMQDPQLGIWHNIDPLADKAVSFSPYVYTFDNPVKFNDPRGMEGEDATGGEGGGGDDFIYYKFLYNTKTHTLTSQEITEDEYVQGISGGGGGDNGSKKTYTYNLDQPGDATDLDKLHHRSQESGLLWVYRLGGQDLAYFHFENAFFQGAGWHIDAVTLFRHFVFGDGSPIVLDERSYTAERVMASGNFSKFVEKFEGEANTYLRQHGTLDGWNGDDALKRYNFGYFLPDVKYGLNNSYLTTIMGGWQHLTANVTVVDVMATFKYTITDHFGAGADDSGKWYFPGLPAMYYLQHYVRNNFTPFIWTVTVGEQTEGYK